MAEPIKIKITDETGTATINANSVSSNSNNQNKAVNQSAKANQKASVVTTAAHIAVMRSVNYTTSNIGKWTGNQHNQAIVNNMKSVIGYGMAFAVNPILGAVSVAFDGLTYMADYAYEQKWDRIKSQQAQARAGGKGGYRR